MLGHEHACRTKSWQLSKRARMETWQCKLIKLIVTGKHRKGDPITNHGGTISEDRKCAVEKKGATIHSQPPEVHSLHRADSCWQSCDEFGAKVSVNRGSRPKKQAHMHCPPITAIFRMYVEGDMTVVGVAADR